MRGIAFLRRLIGNPRGVAAVEFALAMPMMMAITVAGTEAANMAYTSQKLADLATQTADNVSRYRIGISETQITDTLDGMKTMTDNIDFRSNGRIIVSSLQPVLDASGNVTNQKIRWQRCSGARRVSSSYGAADALLGTAGMGPADRKISASADTEIIFVEISYIYKPLISGSFFGTPTMQALSSMVVRDRNNNVPTGTVTSSCSTYAA